MVGARSTTASEGLLRPDAVLGLSAHYLPMPWRSLKAGQCTLPADIVEFKRQGEDGWYALDPLCMYIFHAHVRRVRARCFYNVGTACCGRVWWHASSGWTSSMPSTS